jgi:hypothetical protein
MRSLRLLPLAALLVPVLAAPAAAETPREILVRAAFATTDKTQALSLIDGAMAQCRTLLQRNPADREALLQQALATGYRGQLRRSPGDAKAARDALQSLATAYPRDPEVQVALAGWHLTAVGQLGPFLARAVLGADKQAGFAALDRALALGGNRAFIPAFDALIRLQVEPGDARTPLTLAEQASAAPTPGAVDRIMQRAAVRVAGALRGGDTKAAAALAKQLLPFGGVHS